MWFKNLTLYRFNKPFSTDTEALETALADFTFSPCSSQDISKFGFSNALGKKGQALVHSAENRHLICVTKEEKILPGQVIKEALDEKVALIEDQESRKVTKKEKDAMKEEITMTLLPRAFSRRSQTHALIMPELEMILVDSSSATKAEELLALLRKALGSLPVVPLHFTTPVETTLTEWLRNGASPQPFEMQDEAELKSDSDEGGIVRFKQQVLQEDEVLAHLATGKQVHKLSLHFAKSIAFLLQSDASVKRLKFSEEFRAATDDVGTEDPLAKLDADFALMGGELVAFINAMKQALGPIEENI
ncbi:MULTISPECIES: recombination-associated protein RdgC [unclassified Shewanella]|uniref:recombination-associated protein RdgC n=1 Tax=unclassified Shewanella TaxID=196818 RepID=UPI000C8663EF|nr:MULTISPECIES: recombination-associated protein RdgC [unclassified Shewanella]MDO6618668.1 recombination-associated protein RdgC [Shewanella sp. 6_MG-2023]MDO6641171.1 recombination-associated protein RdgC [Shewanella sp. 5_MG-2023]MDO6678583.1 recombination-associated protein RdgC [Shewanella sp. 4_MG-2023]PMG31970.1 recombination-associated protein RdgC [Shewanella sp. 10N.286.52.C2]PMG49907.1 recombination-associated protein RdgC [Shewanella sp. 10N.286.52.B9]